MGGLSKYLLQILSQKLFDLYLCNKIKCYRVVKKKNDICIFCKPKKK